MATKKIPWTIWKDSDGRGWLGDIGLSPGVERPSAEILEEALDPLTSEQRILDLFSQRWIYLKSEIPRGFERFLRSEGDGYNFTSAQKSLLSWIASSCKKSW